MSLNKIKTNNRFGVSGRRASGGFTLVELMVTVAIVGILVSVAVASYNSATRKTRRSAAQGCLTEIASYMERYYVTNVSYSGAVLPTPPCSADVTPYYTVSLPVLTASTYTVRALPINSQVGESCGTMTITQTGQRTPTSGCW